LKLLEMAAHGVEVAVPYATAMLVFAPVVEKLQYSGKIGQFC
jgi:hypothetical protein